MIRVLDPRESLRLGKRKILHAACLLFLFAVLFVALAPIGRASDEATRRLLAGADAGQVDEIRSALQAGARIDESSEAFAGSDRQPPLVAAALRGHADAVRVLLEGGADPLAGEKDGFNIWHAAAFQGRTVVLRVLVEAETPGYGFHDDGFSPLHRACWGRGPRYTQAVRFLVSEAGKDCGERAKDSRAPIAMTKNPRTAAVLRECLGRKQRNDDRIEPASEGNTFSPE